MAKVANNTGELVSNFVLPFQLEASNLRGRLVRLGTELDSILNRHDYPSPVAHLLGETLVMAITLANTMKYDGVFKLQMEGDGPVSSVFADVTSEGYLRGWARYDEAKLKQYDSQNTDSVLLLQKGRIAFTVQQNGHSQNYQGIVELKGRNIRECVEYYFRQSEQLMTTFRLAIQKNEQGWNASAIMLQLLPDESRRMLDLPPEGKPPADIVEDWQRPNMLLDTLQDPELLNNNISPAKLLHNLFHEEGLRIYLPHQLKEKCRCSDEKVESILTNMSDADVKYYAKDNGSIDFVCEFCNTKRVYSADRIDTLRAMAKPPSGNHLN